MNRREAVQYISLIFGGTVIGSSAFLAGCTSDNKSQASMTFSDGDVALMDEIAETILPTTKTPGAKAAKVGAFMTVMVNDCYTKDDQEIFHKGLTTLDDACNKMHGHGFMKAEPAHRKELLTSLDKDAKEYMKNKKKIFKIVSLRTTTRNRIVSLSLRYLKDLSRKERGRIPA